jgi:hypothetical protein
MASQISEERLEQIHAAFDGYSGEPDRIGVMGVELLAEINRLRLQAGELERLNVEFALQATKRQIRISDLERKILDSGRSYRTQAQQDAWEDARVSLTNRGPNDARPTPKEAVERLLELYP